MATTATPDASGVDELLDAMFDGATTLNRQQLADRLGIHTDTVRAAERRGDLNMIRVTPRRRVASRAAVRRWFLANEERRR